MAILIDQANAGETAADSALQTVAVTTTQPVAGAGFIVVGITWLNTASQTLLSMGGGSLSWTIDKQVSDAGGIGYAIASAQAPAGLASGVILTASFSASVNGARSICVSSFTGVLTSSPVDGTPTSNLVATGSAWSSTAVTVSPGSVLIALAADFNADDSSGGSVTAPALQTHKFGAGTTTFGVIEGYLISPGGSSTIAGTWGASVPSPANAVLAVGYKATPLVPIQSPTVYPPTKFGPF